MRKSGWKWGVLLLAATLVFAAGCAKKQIVREETGGGGKPGVTTTGGKVPPGEERGLTEPKVSETDIARDANGNPLRNPDGSLMTKAQQAAAAQAAKEAEAGRRVVEIIPSQFKDIYFDFDQSSIREDAKTELQNIAAFMQKNPKAVLNIEGHCDSRGTAEYNMALGERRAEAVKKYLVALGVKPGSISTVSFGKEKPAVPGENEEAWAKNRRVHFNVSGIQTTA